MTEIPCADAPPIILAVIGGYLGAGKTTLLNHVLAHAGGRRIAVLVNDFGDINIDAALIRERSSDVIALENGCICCSIGGRLADALMAIAERAERPELLLIEASGVSDPTKVAQIGMLDPAFRLHGTIVAVDAERLDATLGDALVGDIAMRQIAGATALVLTKTDRVGALQKAAAQRTLRSIAPAAVQFEAAHGAVPLALFFDAEVMPRAPRGDSGRLHGARPDQPHAGIGSFSCRFAAPLDKARLKQLFRDFPAPLLRAKGIVRVAGEPAPQTLHVVGGRVRIAPFAGPAPADSVLVFIGCFDDGVEPIVTARLDAAKAPSGG
ncbi:MAG: GTP-binding protein [Burkholderiales bacterium]|nr:GTP-binding protein [Burkholderiales bacterium]MDE2608180.1 GTP-binding protein [Burkholderiales bacterium]